MPILIDTNVLLRSVQPSHPMHVGAVHALEVLMKREEALAVEECHVIDGSGERTA